MTAVKANRCYTIDESQAASYARAGYDIYDGGEIVKHAAGKTVAFEKYKALEAENEALKAENEALKAKLEKPAKPAEKGK